MDVKEFLSDVRRSAIRLKSLQEELDRVRYEIIHLSSPVLGDKVQTSHQSSLDDVLIKLEAQEERYLTEYSALLDKRREAIRLISLEKDPVCQTILQRRYIVGERLEEVAAVMHYSEQHIRRLSERSISDLQKMSGNERFFCDIL